VVIYQKLTKKEKQMRKFEPSPVNLINFGKHKGKTFEDLLIVDPSYLQWLLDTTDPADEKNAGKFAKQNQARIKYIRDLLDSAGDIPNQKPIQQKKPEAIQNLESLAIVLLKIDEKIDKIWDYIKPKGPSTVDPSTVAEEAIDENGFINS